jgi:hypothetical protein
MAQNLPTPVDPAIFASLEPDTVLPEQFFAEQQPNWSGELSLLWTVFIDGIETFKKEVVLGNEGSEAYLETIEWLQVRGSDSIFSFESLCETFGFDPGWVRRALVAWRAKQRSQTQKAA